MPRKGCSVCLHTDAQAIDAALKAGVPLRTLARQHGLSVAAVHRHANHGKPKKTAIKPSQIEKIDHEIRKLVNAKSRCRNKRDSLAISRELRHWYAVRAKAELASIATRDSGMSEPGAISSAEATAMAKAIIEGQLADPDVRAWVMGLAERIGPAEGT